VVPVASVAVLTTGCAPSISETLPASAFAPPPCPPSSATAWVPASSTQTTPGSVCLPDSSGASRHTAAPVARKQTSASEPAQAVRRTGPQHGQAAPGDEHPVPPGQVGEPLPGNGFPHGQLDLVGGGVGPDCRARGWIGLDREYRRTQPGTIHPHRTASGTHVP